ncbi:sulfate adenylyltransferase subunit CysD [Bosea lupini]|jgi:sulfate adenylyltransferase subunit 2|nr:sulfate adenylyltransferase subunit CysD [Bosea lupini]
MSAAEMPPYLRQLESEAIEIIRECYAQSRSTVLLYSIGKDSMVLLHLCLRAFVGRIPFPFLHVDTTWKFREMIAFRDEVAQKHSIDLRVHTNTEAIARGIDPFTATSASYTHAMKTEGLRRALDAGGFDAVIGGARRDEEKSRAKERIFSFRTRGHGWDPRRQRPELWNLYNARVNPGESVRVFPLSNWTELDVWTYIQCLQIPVVDLYFARPRPVVVRSGALIVVDDDRFALRPGERPTQRVVRFRTLGCYPLTGAVDSTAATVNEIVDELRGSRSSERQGRLIDYDEPSAMERKKREGYF